MNEQDIDLVTLGQRVRELRGDTSRPPDGSIVIPVNAQGDLDNVFRLIDDVTKYGGANHIEIVIVVNNYEPEEPPDVQRHKNLGVKVLTIPNVRRKGEVVSFTARIPGIREAGSDNLLLFDADCQLVSPTDLIDWYIAQLKSGAVLAYTHVDYYDVLPDITVRVQLFVHHTSRWIKRVIFRIPVARGSSYAVNRIILLKAYDQNMLADDMNVGPTIKALGGKIVFTNAINLRVLTSGRMFRGGWIELLKYFRYRLRYNLKMLPVGTDATERTDRHMNPVRKYIDNKPQD
jgi:hypothetical protein